MILELVISCMRSSLANIVCKDLDRKVVNEKISDFVENNKVDVDKLITEIFTIDENEADVVNIEHLIDVSNLLYANAMFVSPKLKREIYIKSLSWMLTFLYNKGVTKQITREYKSKKDGKQLKLICESKLLPDKDIMTIEDIIYLYLNNVIWCLLNGSIENHGGYVQNISEDSDKYIESILSEFGAILDEVTKSMHIEFLNLMRIYLSTNKFNCPVNRQVVNAISSYAGCQISTSQPDELKSEDVKGAFLSEYLVKYGDVNLILMLINKDININLCRFAGKQLIQIAVDEGNMEMFVALLNECKDGIDKFFDFSLGKLVHYVAQVGSIEMLGLLVERGADINDPNIYNYNMLPIHYAALGGNKDVLEYIIKQGIDVNSADSNGWIPLCYAVKSGHLDVCEFLIENGAFLDSVTSEGLSPLHYAIIYEKTDILRLLIDKKANVHVLFQDLDLFKYTIRLGRTDMLRVLFECIQFESNDETDVYILELFNIAIRHGRLEILTFLIDNGYSLDPNLLHYAAAKGFVDICSLLIQEGIDVNYKNYNGQTPLHYAVRKNKPHICHLLIDNNSNKDIKDNNGKTPLDMATSRTNQDIVNLLSGN